MEYIYQLKSSWRLFPRWRDRFAFLVARLFRQARWMPMPGCLARRQFRIEGLARPICIRPHTADFNVVREMFQRREYQGLLEGLPPAEPVRFVLDLGANIGMSMRLWDEMFSDARIIGLEPVVDNAEICRENLILANRPERLLLLEAGIAQAPGKLWLDRRHSTLGHRLTPDPVAGVPEIRVYSVPELLREVGWTGPIDLLKCDIEGAERGLFENCSDWIGGVRSLVVETHDGFSLEALADCLRSAGSTMELVSTNLRDPLRPLAYFRCRGGS